MAPVTPGGDKMQKDQLEEQLELQELRIGVIRETKTPADKRVPLTPEQCSSIMKQYKHITIVVQSSDIRCYSDDEYREAGVEVVESLSDCSILMGVKEVQIDSLLEDKTYFFFSHTIKEQSYNAKLLAAVMRKRIRLVDYECLRDETGQRVIAFGRWAGIVGAHNTIVGWGRRTGTFSLPELHNCRDFKEGSATYADLDLRGVRVVLTGTGRVANGAREVLEAMNMRQVTKEQFLSGAVGCSTEEPVFVQLGTADIFSRDGKFDRSFYTEPHKYQAQLMPYLSRANIFINGIYWDCRAPSFFTLEDVTRDDWTVQVIGDITCDIAPQASVPTTLRPAKIGDAFFGFDRRALAEASSDRSFDNDCVTMMTVDNLPNELPRDASEDFGSQFVRYVLPHLVQQQQQKLQDEQQQQQQQAAAKSMLYSATIADSGKLNLPYQYLSGYADIGMRQLV